MRLWDLETGINKAMYQGHSYPIWSVDSDRVGVNIATGKFDSIFFIFYCIDVEFQVHFKRNFEFSFRFYGSYSKIVAHGIHTSSPSICWS